MRIGLIIAIERELKAFINYGNELETEEINNKLIYKCNINGHEVYAIKSGYGIIDAAAATQFLITKYGVNLIVNFGVTGALDRSLKVSDLFVVRKVLNYDYDVSNIDPVKKHQYEEFKDEFIPLDEEMINFVKTIYPNIKEAIVASGAKFIDDKKEKEELFNKGCNICDMEIASIARISYLNGVKALSIKCISDTYDGDGGDFIKNVTSSAEKAFKVIIEILKRI